MKDTVIWLFMMVVIFGLSGCGLADSVSREPIEMVAAIESSISQDAYKLAELSDRYPHGALGDLFEPTQVVRINNAGEKEPLIDLPETQVFETNRILFVDLVDDSEPELLLTVSDHSLGSANVVYDLSGNELARTDFTGQVFKWRHLLGVMANESGQKFVVDVVAPHSMATLTLYELQGDKLLPIHKINGYPSHTFGSDKLDAATITNHNGRDILRIPNQDGNEHFLYVEGSKLVLLDK